jgi:hypothetical protein
MPAVLSNLGGWENSRFECGSRASIPLGTAAPAPDFLQSSNARHVNGYRADQSALLEHRQAQRCQSASQADVLARIADMPQSQMAELLPNWCTTQPALQAD